MNTPFRTDPEEEEQILAAKVTLIVNGLNENGRLLARLLADRGSDVAIVSFQPDPALAGNIQRDVEAVARRCLILTPKSVGLDGKRPFPAQAIEKILEAFGRLDIFINCGDAGETAVPTTERRQYSGAGLKAPAPKLFDSGGITQAALLHTFATG